MRNIAIINQLFANAMKNNKIRIKQRSKDNYVLQANFNGIWHTVEEIHAGPPQLKVVD